MPIIKVSRGKKQPLTNSPPQRQYLFYFCKEGLKVWPVRRVCCDVALLPTHPFLKGYRLGKHYYSTSISPQNIWDFLSFHFVKSCLSSQLISPKPFLFFFSSSLLLQFRVSSTLPLHPGCCCLPTTRRSTATTCTACGWSSPTLRAESIWPSMTSAWRNNLISSPSRMEERYCCSGRLLSSITLKAWPCVLAKQPSLASLHRSPVYPTAWS